MIFNNVSDIIGSNFKVLDKIIGIIKEGRVVGASFYG